MVLYTRLHIYNHQIKTASTITTYFYGALNSGPMKGFFGVSRTSSVTTQLIPP